jgi:FKBP-type peptidyl-prolyl cis-trans isomerase
MVVNMKMNEVMDKATFDKRKAKMEADKRARLEKLQAQESKSIADYIKSHGIKDEPNESGIYVLSQEEGEGAVAQWGDEVAVHYVLRNLKGEPIESSYDYGRPMVFTIGGGEMIYAIDEALMTMAPGAKVTLLTPSERAFGEFDLGEALPPYSPLIIDLELVEIK